GRQAPRGQLGGLRHVRRGARPADGEAAGADRVETLSKGAVMEPRGQLWFELQRVVQDFRAFSGLPPQQALGVLVAVLRNLLADQEAELAKLTGPAGGPEEVVPHDE